MPGRRTSCLSKPGEGERVGYRVGLSGTILKGMERVALSRYSFILSLFCSSSASLNITASASPCVLLFKNCNYHSPDMAPQRNNRGPFFSCKSKERQYPFLVLQAISSALSEQSRLMCSLCHRSPLPPTPLIERIAYDANTLSLPCSVCMMASVID